MKIEIETTTIPEIDNFIQEQIRNIANFRSKQIDSYFLPIIKKEPFIFRFFMKLIYKFEEEKIGVLKSKYTLKRFGKTIASKII